MTTKIIAQMDEEDRVSALMGILMQVDRIVSDAEGTWTFDAIDCKDDLKNTLVQLFGVDADRVDELVEDGDGDLPT